MKENTDDEFHQNVHRPFSKVPVKNSSRFKRQNILRTEPCMHNCFTKLGRLLEGIIGRIKRTWMLETADVKHTMLILSCRPEALLLWM